VRPSLIGFEIALALGLGCSGPPTGFADVSEPFDWRVAVSELDEALLAGCGHQDALYVVGGARDTAVILEWTGSEWFAPALPQGAGVLWWCWVDQAGTAWAVGERGTVLRKSGGALGDWMREDLRGAVDPQSTLFGIWGAAPDDVWAVGGSLTNPDGAPAIAHLDGQEWRPADTRDLPAQPLFKVWGTGPDDVWAVGAQGTAIHQDGTGWTAVVTPTQARLVSVWGTSPGNVYAVGGAGTGIVLRYDGSAWSLLADAPEELAAVWTAPGQPLYVGGNRGFMGRYALDDAGRADPARMTMSIAAHDLCVHALHGADSALIATAADLLGGGASGWRGAILVHGDAALDGTITREPGADAGADAAMPDGGAPDGATGPGPGETCGQVPDVCAPGLECWLLLQSGQFLCTQPCSDATMCAAYGSDPCCVLPGPQTLETVCVPGQYAECAP
jgi:hypothetical protein